MKNSAIAREKEAGNGSDIDSAGATRPNGAETQLENSVLPLSSFDFTLVL